MNDTTREEAPKEAYCPNDDEYNSYDIQEITHDKRY